MRAAIAMLLTATLGTVAVPLPVAARQPAPPAGLSLAQAVAVAVERNPQVRAGEATVRGAEAQLALARAAFAPTAGVSATAGASGSPSSSSASVQVVGTVTYLVYDGGVRQARVRQAEALLESARQGLATVRHEIAFQAVQTFMAVIVAEQVITLREQGLAQAQTQLQAAEANFRAGRVARADVVRAQSGVAAAEFELVDARGQHESRLTALRTLLGLEPGTPVTAQTPDPPPAVAVADDEAAQRALLRPEVRRAEADVRASEAALAAAMIQGGVTATLDGRYVLVTVGTTSPTTWSVGVSATIPLFDGGRRVAAVEQARADLDANRARLEGVRLQMRQEALQARLQVASAAARAAAAERAAAAAGEAQRLADGRFTAGVGTILEVVTARTERMAAEVTLVQVASERWIAAARLRRAIALPVLP